MYLNKVMCLVTNLCIKLGESDSFIQFSLRDLSLKAKPVFEVARSLFSTEVHKGRGDRAPFCNSYVFMHAVSGKVVTSWATSL